MTIKTQPRTLRSGLLAAAVGVVLLGGLESAPVRAASSFPDYPLQSGAGTVPPNILFMLDNSGSMADTFMPVPGAATISDVNITSSRAVNSLAYDPRVTYAPWDTTDASGGATTVTGGTTYSAAYLDDNQATTTGTIGGNTRSMFYVLRNASAPATATSYDRYRIDSNGVLQKAAVTSVNTDGTLAINAMARNAFTDYTVSLPGNTGSSASVYLTPVGTWTGDADVYVTWNGTTPTTTNYQCASAGYTAVEECDFNYMGAVTLKVRVYAYTATQAMQLQVKSTRFGSESAGVPSSRSNADEVTNIATWYSFHRTRMKVAKAGASRAFIGLGSGFRVGYDTINADNGTPNTTMRYAIPVGTNSGRFESANKIAWFTRLQAQSSGGGTPLRSALKRSGEYYQTAAPWTDGTGTAEQACRASYTLLSTDGYWNSDDGFSIGGDVDGDGASDTLADVAKYFWQTDLRTTLDNLVPTTPKDTANWQHMGVFGVSIGQQGTVPVSTTPPTTWPDPTVTEDARRIDDLWHASVNARGAFIVASQADEYAKALRSALDNIKEQVASGSNLTANGNSLNSGSQIFQAMFTSRLWSGDIKAFDISAGGIAATEDWSLAAQANEPSNNFAARPVMTWYNNAGGTFDTAHVANLTAYARTGTPAVTAADNIAYLKGDRSQELQNGGTLRDRRSPIGDIVNSSPFYQRETGMVFIGANDGMLHGIDSDTGKVLFSYVPAGIDVASFASLSDPYYFHHFFVDGQMDVSSAAQGSGKNILVGALGRGGKGVFALDVTGVKASPSGFLASNVLWDKTAASDNDMGYVLGQPLVRKGNNGTSLVIVGNGVESTNGKAVLYIYVLNSSGTISSTLKFDTLVAGGNGMSEPRAADTDGNGTVDAIYAGDLKGNLWKLDVSDASTSRWDFAYATNNGANGTPLPMFTARDPLGNAQPITGAVALAREPGSGKIFVNFGTGKLLSQSDVVTQSSIEQTQTLYGLIDDGQPITTYSGNQYTELQQRTIAYVGTDSTGRTARSFEAYSVLPTTKRGWYLNLATNAQTYARGERVVTAPLIRGRASWVSSLVPNLGEGCANTGKGFLNVLDVFTGTNPSGGSFIDVNGNGQGDDKVSVSGTTPSGTNGYVSSIDLGVAMPGQPVQIGDLVAVGGSNAKTGSVRKTGGTDKPQRLNWREIINRQ
jgi:type IV pilus assembly protein PilY1